MSNICEDDDIWDLFNEKSKEEKSSLVVCISCKSDLLINDKGNIICKDCGTINEHVFDQNPEWFHNDDCTNQGSVRYGAPTNYFLPKSSLSTVIVGKCNNKIKT
jgi:transcription initiation factor TFIIIB Brf1 subunit/transcription initiation factor TFIIB